MHELSLAMSIADIAKKTAIKENATNVKEIEIEVGEWAGVDTGALKFSLEVTIAKNDLFKDCNIAIIKLENTKKFAVKSILID